MRVIYEPTGRALEYAPLACADYYIKRDLAAYGTTGCN